MLHLDMQDNWGGGSPLRELLPWALTRHAPTVDL